MIKASFIIENHTYPILDVSLTLYMFLSSKLLVNHEVAIEERAGGERDVEKRGGGEG